MWSHANFTCFYESIDSFTPLHVRPQGAMFLHKQEQERKWEAVMYFTCQFHIYWDTPSEPAWNLYYSGSWVILCELELSASLRLATFSERGTFIPKTRREPRILISSEWNCKECGLSCLAGQSFPSILINFSKISSAIKIIIIIKLFPDFVFS